MMPKRDFIYLCIILSIILISVTSLILGDSQKAGENLNFAATTVSIVLAVIAIIMTIVDSSGQRNNIVLLKETVDKVQNSYSDVKELVDRSVLQLKEISELKDELILKMTETVEWRNTVIEKLNMLHPLQDNEDGDNQEFEEHYQELLEYVKIKPRLLTDMRGNVIDYNVGDQVSHVKWGIGDILSVRGEGDDTELLINFPEPVYNKRLLARFAPITKVKK